METCTKYAIYCEENGKDSLCVVVDSLADAQKEKGTYVAKKGRIEESRVENFGQAGEKVLDKKVIESWEATGATGAPLSSVQKPTAPALPIDGAPPAPQMAGGGATLVTPPVKELSSEEKWKEFFAYYIGHGSFLGGGYNLPETKKTETEKNSVVTLSTSASLSTGSIEGSGGAGKKTDDKPDFTVEEYVDAIELKHGKESLSKAKQIIEQKISPVNVSMG